MDKVSIEQTLNLLTEQYGERDWQPLDSPLNVLIQTILSQNTSDINSRRAFESLRTVFPSWEAVVAAPASNIAAAIKVGGLGDIKSKRIQQALEEIGQRRGRLELEFLNELPLSEAKDWLRHLPGVGTKTANCVFLFSFGKPALPVDTHIFRVSKRLGLIDSKTSVEKAHLLLEDLVPPDKVYQFHKLVIEHGRKICKAQLPRCLQCRLNAICPSYETFTGSTVGARTRLAMLKGLSP